MNIVVFVNGPPRAGKDTAVSFMCNKAREIGWHAEAVSSIDCIRDALHRIGVDVSGKTDADRDLLSELGASLEKHSGYRTLQTVKAIEDSCSVLGYPNMIFVHVREAVMMRKIASHLTGWTKTSMYVSNPNVVTTARNASDQEALKPLNCGHIIVNDGSLNDLCNKCEALVQKIIEPPLV